MEAAAMRAAILGVLAAAALGGAAAADVPAYDTAAVANPLRPDGDRARDGAQKPAEVMAFAGVKPGQKIADFWPAPPYSTRLLSAVVGPKGHVYAILPQKLMADMPGAEADTRRSLAA